MRFSRGMKCKGEGTASPPSRTIGLSIAAAPYQAEITLVVGMEGDPRARKVAGLIEEKIAHLPPAQNVPEEVSL
jgi:hypothetical protein